MLISRVNNEFNGRRDRLHVFKLFAFLIIRCTKIQLIFGRLKTVYFQWRNSDVEIRTGLWFHAVSKDQLVLWVYDYLQLDSLIHNAKGIFTANIQSKTQLFVLKNFLPVMVTSEKAFQYTNIFQLRS